METMAILSDYSVRRIQDYEECDVWWSVATGKRPWGLSFGEESATNEAFRLAGIAAGLKAIVAV